MNLRVQINKLLTSVFFFLKNIITGSHIVIKY